LSVASTISAILAANVTENARPEQVNSTGTTTTFNGGGADTTPDCPDRPLSGGISKTLSDFVQHGYLMGEMQPKSDARLLREYAEHGTERAFTEIVTRHTNLVYSAAVRQTESPDLATEITQSVFIGLAQGARTLLPRLAGNASLAGWLCRSARNISLNLRRDEFRQHSRERQAMELLDPISETAPDWERLRPVLDEAMSELSEPDYDALVMRFFNQQDLRSIGRALGVTDDTAQKRVSRALDKLREHLSRRGINSAAAALTAVLSANAIQAAPAGLTIAISAAALAGTVISTPTLIATTKTIAMTTIQKALVTITTAVAIGTGIYEARQNSTLRGQVQTLQEQFAPLADQIHGLQQGRDDAANKLAALSQENKALKGDLADLPKLRGEVARLRGNAPPVNDPAYSAYKSLLDRIDKLKQRVAETPGARIPEMRLLSEEDYTSATRSPLNTERDYLAALSNLRSTAEFKFITTLLNPALSQYAQANHGQFPSDLAQLQPYFPSSVEDAILERWEIAPANTVRTDNLGDPIITQKAAVDEDFDPRYAVGLKGFASAGLDTSGHNGWGVVSPDIILGMAAKAYEAANNGQQPTDPSQILAYLTTLEQQAALQKMLKWKQEK
jgi:RNA polymerase sigma factor (sigma-70 family)